MKIMISTSVLNLLVVMALTAQTIDFADKVDLIYRDIQLEEVIEDLSERYDLRFSYSRDIIPLDQSIFINLTDVQFKDGLDSMLSQTQVIYGFIADQLVLSIDEDKNVVEPDLVSMGYLPDEPLLASNDELDTYRLLFTPVETIPFRKTNTYELAQSENQQEDVSEVIHERTVSLPAYQSKANPRESIPGGIQVSLVPGVGWTSNEFYEDQLAFSLNGIGNNDATLEGCELGLIGNALSGEMTGLQMAGIYNIAEGELEGAQLAGVANYGGEYSKGLLASGLFNAHESINGAQMTGGVNVVSTYSSGLQMAGIGNVAKSRTSLTQIAGVYNISQEEVSTQISGLFNVADRINGTQVSSVLNVGSHVRGSQIGLINISDTLDGVAFGLINIVKKGYHSFEFAGEDISHYNAMIRLGTRGFYNIFRAGVQRDWDSWTLGFGLGTSIKLHRRNYLQFELHASHVNENENWTNKLNLLSQFYMNFDIALSKGVSITAGPTANLMISQLYHPEDGYGSQLMNYTIIDKTYDDSVNHEPVNLKFWVGFHLGFRFNSG